MRFMILAKASEDSEAGVAPSEEYLVAQQAYDKEMADAGVLLVEGGLHPGSEGARVRFSGGRATVTEGAPSGEVVAGFWLIQVASMDEAIGWAKRCPMPTPDTEAELEVRQVAE